MSEPLPGTTPPDEPPFGVPTPPPIPTPEQPPMTAPTQGGYAPPPAPQGYAPPPPTPQQGYATPPPGAPTAYGPATLMSDADQRTWAMIAQLGGILFYFVPSLIIYLVTKGRGAFVETEAKEALNFQITLAIVWAVGFITLFIFVGIIILLAAAICAIVFCILAAMANYAGTPYRYPLTIRFIK